MAKSHRHMRQPPYESLATLEKKDGWENLKTIDDLKGLLAAWMRDFQAWGEDVRDDIIRLETAVRAAPGEPGDPPPAPRKQ